MNPDIYNNLLTQQGPALQGATMVPFLGAASQGLSNTGKSPIPYTQRGGSIIVVSGLLILGGFLARSRNMDLPSNMMLGSGAIVAGYGIARIT
jgi:hypothetical protein